MIVPPATWGSRRHLDRHGLAGQHRRVNRGLALLDDTVGGELVPRPDDEPFTHLELFDGNELLSPVAQDAGLLDAELEQLADRIA